MTSKNPQTSVPGDVSEIQLLTATSERLRQSVDSWNSWYIVFGLIALVVAFLVFFAQWRIIRKGKELSAIQSDLIGAKDRLLKIDLAEKDRQLGEVKRESKEKTDALELKAKQADGEIQDAKTDAARASERAAIADRAAESERLARVNLEAEIAPRRLTTDQGNAIVAGWRSALSGRSVRVDSYALDVEGMILGVQLVKVFEACGMQVEPNLGSQANLGGIELGVHVSGSDSATVIAIRSALRGSTKLAIFDDPPHPQAGIVTGPLGPTAVLVFVGAKPIK